MTERIEHSLTRLKSLADSSRLRTEKARAMATTIKVARDYRWVGLYDVTPEEIVAIAWTGSEPPAYPRFPVTKGQRRRSGDPRSSDCSGCDDGPSISHRIWVYPCRGDLPCGNPRAHRWYDRCRE